MIRTLLAIAVCCAPARAAAELIVEGPAQVEGDGRTAVTLEVRSDVVTDGELSARASAGVVRRITRTADGFEVELVPPRVVADLDARIELSLTGPSGSDARAHEIVFTKSEMPTHQQSSGGPFDLRGPDRVFLGDSALVSFSIDVANRQRPPVLVVSAGQVGELELDSGGRLAATWSPPVESYPRVLFVVALSADNAEIDTLIVPLYGQGRVKLESEPNASVTVRVGEIDFGPVRTDSKGRAELAVAAQPGIDVAKTVAKDSLGNETLGKLRLGAPPFPRLFAACPPAADRIVVLAVTEAGQASTSPDFEVRASSGSFGDVEAIAPGVFQARLSSAPAADLELSAALRGQPDSVSRCRPPDTPGRLAGASGYTIVVRGGYLSNLGRLDGPVLATDASYRFPLREVAFSLGLHVAIVFGFDSTDSAGMDPETIRTQIVAVPVMAQFSIGVPLRQATPFVSGGAGIVLARGSVSSRSADITRTATRPAARGGIGVAVPLGPGSLVVEAAYLHATIDEAEIRGRIGGAHVTAGYGWAF